MIQPTGGSCIKVSSVKESERRKLSRPLITFFACTQLIFGFNFGFLGQNGRFKTATRFVTVSSGSIMIIIIMASFYAEDMKQPSFLAYFVQYVSFFIIFLFAKYTLHDFLTDLPNERDQTKCEYKNVEMLLWLYATLLFGAKTATAIFYCSHTLCTDLRLSIVDIVFHTPMIALDIIPIASFIVSYHVYACLKDMTARYEHREITLKQLQKTFKELADNFEEFRRNYDAILVFWFLTESVKWMTIIWNHLTLVKSTSSWWLQGSSYTWAFFNTTQICVPAMFAEMISKQTDAMKLTLNERLLAERDEPKKTELLRLLRYVEARPLLRKAWRLVPVDLRQPVTMLSMCTTYLIVIIQLTHLFD